MDINNISSSQSNTRDRKLIFSPSSYFSNLPIFSILSIFDHFNQMGPNPKEIWDVVEISAY